MNRILIINPFGIGDVLFTTPMIANLKRAYPQAYIAYISNRRTEEFLRLNPKIDHVLVYERDEFHAIRYNPIRLLGKWFSLIKEISDQRCDAVFDLSFNRMFGALCWICGIPKRIGYDYRRRGMFLNHKATLKGYEGRHVIEYYLDLLRWVGVDTSQKTMEMPVAREHEDWAKQWLKDKGIADRKLVAIVPGGGQSWGGRAVKKRWPAEKYAQLTDKIVAEGSAAVILMGDSREEPLCREVAALVHSPVYSAVGQTSLTQMAALFKQCRLAVVNDGGPLHVAVASGTKTVSIFGPVDEVVYGPYPPSADHQVVTKGLACQPCYRKFFLALCGHISCLRDLSLDDVYRKVKSAL